MLPSACSFIVDVSCHCLTLHISAYMAKKKTTEKQMEKCKVWPRAKEKQKTSEADSFRNMKIKISYTLEDGHVDRNM
jgi:hypothetical protein